MSEKLTLDFQESKDKLIHCQKEKQFTSCMQCPQILECKIREDFVCKTYSYLNKGSNGDFNF